MIVGFAFHGRRVVGSHGTVESALSVNAQHSHHVGRPVVVESLAEALARSFDVAKVDEKDLLLRAPLAGQRRDVLAHQLEICLAERDAVHGAGHDVQDPAVVRGARHDAPDPS